MPIAHVAYYVALVASYSVVFGIHMLVFNNLQFFVFVIVTRKLQSDFAAKKS